MYSFAGLISRTPPPTFSDTAITDCNSDTTFSSLEHTWSRYSGLLDRKIVRTCATGGSRTLDSLREWRTPNPLGQALQFSLKVLYTMVKKYIDY